MDLRTMADAIPHGKFGLLTDTIALTAVVSPIWLPALKEVSEIAAYLLPIAGVMFLVVKIIAKVYITRKIARGEIRAVQDD